MTTDPDGAVKLRTSSSWPDNHEPTSVPTLLRRMAAKGGEHVALAVKRDSKWIR